MIDLAKQDRQGLPSSVSDGLACYQVCIMPLRSLVLCAGEKQIFEKFRESKISRTSSSKSGRVLQVFNRSKSQTTYLHMEVGKCLGLDNSISMHVPFFSCLREVYTTDTQTHQFKQSRSILHYRNNMHRARLA